MAAPQTTFAQVQTDSIGSPSPYLPARPVSTASSGRGSVASTSSLEGADSAFESVDLRLSRDAGGSGKGLARLLSRSSDSGTGGAGSRRSLLRERFSSGLGRISTEGISSVVAR